MRIFLTILLICCSAVVLQAELYLFTGEGRIASSTDRGANWTWQSVVPYSSVQDIAHDTTGNIYLVSETGEVMRSTDKGTSWTTLSTVSMVKSKAIWIFGNNDIFVMTEQGDVARSTNGGTSFNWVGTIGASDMVDLIGADGLFAFTNSGDVFRSSNLGASWTGVGTISQMGVVGATPTTTGLYAITESGDLARSTDNGANWSFISTVSQTGITGITNANDTLFIATKEGDVARSDNGTSWTWRGTASQVFTGGIGSDEMSILAIEEIEVALEATPPGIRLRFTLHSDEHTAINWRIDRKEGEGRRASLVTVSGEKNTYLDCNVQEGMQYSYWLTVLFDDGGKKEAGPFVITFPFFSPGKISIYSLFPEPVKDRYYLVIGSPEDLPAEIMLYNSAGQQIKRLWSGILHRGYTRLFFDADTQKLKTGIYFIRVKIKKTSLFHKLTVVE